MKQKYIKLKPVQLEPEIETSLINYNDKYTI